MDQNTEQMIDMMEMAASNVKRVSHTKKKKRRSGNGFTLNFRSQQRWRHFHKRFHLSSSPWLFRITFDQRSEFHFNSSELTWNQMFLDTNLFRKVILSTRYEYQTRSEQGGGIWLRNSIIQWSAGMSGMGKLSQPFRNYTCLMNQIIEVVEKTLVYLTHHAMIHIWFQSFTSNRAILIGPFHGLTFHRNNRSQLPSEPQCMSMGSRIPSLWHPSGLKPSYLKNYRISISIQDYNRRRNKRPPS
jgi:hypothetical protein